MEHHTWSTNPEHLCFSRENREIDIKELKHKYDKQLINSALCIIQTIWVSCFPLFEKKAGQVVTLFAPPRRDFVAEFIPQRGAPQLLLLLPGQFLLTAASPLQVTACFAHYSCVPGPCSKPKSFFWSHPPCLQAGYHADFKIKLYTDKKIMEK